MGRQHQGMYRPGVRQVPEGGGELGKMEKTGCKIICGAPTTLAVKGLMMTMMMMMMTYDACLLVSWRKNNNNKKTETELTASVLKKRSKTHTKLKERFLIGRNSTKRANFRGSPLFEATNNYNFHLGDAFYQVT